MRLFCYVVVPIMVTSLAACGIGTGIRPAGPDAFKVTEMYPPVQGGAARAKRVALADAARFCEDSGKKFLPINTPEEGTRGPTDYTVTFRCLPSGAPDPQ
jgi:hypothetical protein